MEEVASGDIYQPEISNAIRKSIDSSSEDVDILLHFSNLQNSKRTEVDLKKTTSTVIRRPPSKKLVTHFSDLVKTEYCINLEALHQHQSNQEEEA